MKTLNSFIQLSRPFTLLSPAIGFISGGVMAWKAEHIAGALPRAVFIGAAASLLLNVFSNSLNQIYDIDIDRINQPKRPLPSGRINARQAGAFTILCLIISLGVAAAINLPLLIIFAAAAFATWAYSAPPLRAKARGALANLTIAVARGLLLFVSGWTSVAPPDKALPWAAGFILALYVFGAASTKDFSDVEGDRACGISTLPIRFGPAAAAKIIAPFLVAPFLLVPAFIAAGVFPKTTLPLTALAFYGLFIAALLIRENSAPQVRPSRASWIHMYLLLILAQAGFAVCYLWL